MGMTEIKEVRNRSRYEAVTERHEVMETLLRIAKGAVERFFRDLLHDYHILQEGPGAYAWVVGESGTHIRSAAIAKAREPYLHKADDRWFLVIVEQVTPSEVGPASIEGQVIEVPVEVIANMTIEGETQ